MDEERLQAEAQAAYDWIELGERPDGERFYRFREGAPDCYNADSVGADIRGTLVWVAHDDGNFLPDDYRYEYMAEALERIAEGYDIDGEEIEADVYTSELLDWMKSDLRRAYYGDEALEQHGGDLDFITLLMVAQAEEKREVHYAVKSWLEERIRDG